eukprot:gene26858-biopygen17444
MNSCHEEGVCDRNRAGIGIVKRKKRKKKKHGWGIGDMGFSPQMGTDVHINDFL